MGNPYVISAADGDTRYVRTGQRGLTFHSLAHESRYAWAAKRFDLTGRGVLDFGCGSGYGTFVLGQSAALAVGIDKSETSIAFASAEYGSPNVSFHSGDACAPDVLPDRSFDFVFSFDVIEHLERYFEYLANAVRLMKPGGTFVVGCPNRLQTFNWNRQWNRYHFQEFSPYQLRVILSRYFREVALISQDFENSATREKARIENLGPVTISLKRKIRSAIPDSMLSPLHKLKNLARPNRRSFGFALSDIHFAEEPGDSSLDGAFGIIAICGSPQT